MPADATLAWIIQLSINVLLLGLVLHQRAKIAHYQHIITQNMIILNQTKKVLDRSVRERTLKGAK